MLVQSKTQPSVIPPVRVFYSYAHKDEDLKERLDEHLTILKREGLISAWHDRNISAGEDWAGKIDKHLESAEIILLLISASFMASDYCFDIEMSRALERHGAGQAYVIPIILRPANWQNAPFARLLALPKDGKPVVGWRDRNKAFAEIVEGIRKAAINFRYELSPALEDSIEEIYKFPGATISAASTPTAPGPSKEDTGLFMPPSREELPVILKGMLVEPDNPTNPKFIIDSGNSNAKGNTLTQEERKLIEYFRAALTIDEKDLWVNLSAYESNRMIPPALGGTRLGRDILEQDCALKCFAASLMHPDQETGRSYWEAVHASLYNLYGTSEIPVSSYQKVWLIPDKAVIYEKGADIETPKILQSYDIPREHIAGFIVESHVEVRCESELLAFSQKDIQPKSQTEVTTDKICLDLFKKILIPAIEREVNKCSNFHTFQQAQSAIVLATWYKRAFAGNPAVESLIAKGPDKVSTAIIDEVKIATKKDADEELKFFRELDSRAREYVLQTIGNQRPVTLDTIQSLAIQQRNEGKLERARFLQEELLRVRCRFQGENDPETQVAMSQLGRTLLASGEGQEARRLHERVLEIRRRYWGDKHPYTLNSMIILADTLLDQGELEDAHKLRKQVDDIKSEPGEAGDLSSSSFEVSENKEIYSKYMRLFRDGVCHCSRNEFDPNTRRTMTRSYFTGAIHVGSLAKWLLRVNC